MHDCEVAAGDNWLRRLIPEILHSSAWRNGGMLVIVSDEGTDNDSPGGRALAIIATPTVKAGTQIHQSFDHYGLLATIEDLWHLPRLKNSAQAHSIASALTGASQPTSMLLE
jgi:hypothetical protein